MAINQTALDQNTLNRIEQIMNKHGSEMANILQTTMSRIHGSGMGAIGGFRRTDDQKEYKDDLENFLRILKKNAKTLSATEQFQREAAKREVRAVNEAMREANKNRKEGEKNTEATKDNTKGKDENTKSVKDSTSAISDWAKSIATGTLSFTAASRAVDEFQQAYKTGLNWNAIGDSIQAAFTMGLSPKEMMEFQAKFRRVSNTFDGGISQFNESIAANQNEWKKYSGSLRDAAMAQAEFADIALAMGAGSKNLDYAVNGLFNQFKQLQSITSMTTEQFAAMQRSMLSEESVRWKLVGLQQKERANQIMGLTQTSLAMRALGMQEEVADRVVKYIESQSVSPAKQRLKESYQMATAGRMYGMDEESLGRLGQLWRKGSLRSSEENQQLVELSKMYAESKRRYMTSGSMNGDIYSNEFRGNYMSDVIAGEEAFLKMGIDRSLAEGAAASSEAIMKQQQEIADRNEGMWGTFIEKFTNFSNMFGAWGQSALAALIGAGWGLSKMGGLFGGGSGGTGGVGGAGDKMKKMWGALGKGGKAGVFGILAGLAGSAAQVVFDPQTETKQNIWDKATMGGAAGATIGSLIAPGLGTAIGGALGTIVGAAYAKMEDSGAFDTQLDVEKKAMLQQVDNAKLLYEFEQRRYSKELEQLEGLQAQAQTLHAQEKKRFTDRMSASRATYLAEEQRYNSELNRIAGLKSTNSALYEQEKMAIDERLHTAKAAYNLEERRYKSELEKLEGLESTDKELHNRKLARIEELKTLLGESTRKYEAATTQQNTEQFIYNAKNANAVNLSLKELSKDIENSWGVEFGTTKDVDQKLSEIQGRLSIAGVDVSQTHLREMLGNKFEDLMVENGVNSIDAIKTRNALASGENWDYDSTITNTQINELIGKAVAEIIPDLNAKMTENLQAQAVERFTSKESVESLQQRILDLQASIQKDRELLALAETVPEAGYDSTGARQRIQENEQLAILLQQLVNKDTMKTDENTVQLFERMTEALETMVRSNNGGRVRTPY